MMRSFEKRKGGVTSLIVLVCMILIGWFGIRPLLALVEEERDGIQEILALREKRQEQILRMPEYEAQYHLAADRMDELDIFIEEDRMVQFIKDVEAIAETTRVAVTFEAKESLQKKKTGAAAPKVSDDDEAGESKSKPAKKDDTILGNLPSASFIPVGVKARGQYEDVAQFLQKLETLHWSLDVISVSFREVEKEIEEQEAPSLSGVANPFDGGQIEPRIGPRGTGSPEKVFEVEGAFDVVVYKES